MSLNPANEGDIRLVGGFAQDRRYGQGQPRKQSVKALAGNSKYSKGDEGHQKVAKQETLDDSAAGRGISRLNRDFCNIYDDFLEPVEVEESDYRSYSESCADTPSEKGTGSDQGGKPEDGHDAGDTLQSTGVEVVVVSDCSDSGHEKILKGSAISYDHPD
jgi:hypothetical protein